MKKIAPKGTNESCVLEVGKGGNQLFHLYWWARVWVGAPRPPVSAEFSVVSGQPFVLLDGQPWL